MPVSSRTHALSWLVPLCGLLASATGCTTALTTASLRALNWEATDPAAESTADADAEADDGPDAATLAIATDAAESEDDMETRRAAAIEEAVDRLSRLGTLDDATQAALVATLQQTQPEDWPVVVAEFATALTANRRTKPVTDASGDTAEPHVVAKADVAAATTPGSPPASEQPAPEPSPQPVPLPAPEPAPERAADSPAADQPTAPEPDTAASDEATASAARLPAVSIRTACFASRVQAWGVFDRFAADRFRPGQEVIVYVELDDLSSSRSADGHTTCIDASLRLVSPSGRLVHEWNFEPIAETCGSRRRDYFARYVVRIPDSAPPGDCRVEVTITDTLADRTATATLPLEIRAD